MRLILNFHGIGLCDRPYETNEKPYWLTSEAFELCLDLAVSRAHQTEFAYTFDDGNRSDITIALPALQKRGLCGRFFVLSDKIGDPGYLSAGDLRAMLDAGMSIGSHGAGHKDWRHVSDAVLDREIVDARAVISDVIGQNVTEASIPFGSYDRRVIQRLRRAGYQTVYSSDGGAARAGDWFQPRLTLRCDLMGAGLDSLLTPPSLGRTVTNQAKLFLKRLR